MALRSLTIDDINALEHGEVIPHFQGRITKVFDQKTGSGEWGPWHLQTMMVGEGPSEIAVTWTGEDTFNDWEGALVSFECSENKLGKLVGVLRDIRMDKQGKEWRGVKVTTAAKIKRLENQQQKVPQQVHGRSENSANSKPIENQTKPKPNGDKITAYAQHASRVFTVAWEQSKDIMALIPKEDGEGMSTFEWNDLRLRIAQNFAIEIAKIIRKERF